MVNFIIIISVLLVLVILFLLFRLQGLLAIYQNSDNKVGTSNRINGALMAIVPIIGLILMITSANSATEYFLPESASTHGAETDTLFWITMVVIILMFVITNAGLFYFAARYQYKEGRKSQFFHDNTKLEITWTIVPAVILTILVFYGNKVWWDIMGTPPQDAEEIEIVGQQFAWKARYPGKDKKLGAFDYRLIDAVNELGLDFKKKASKDDFITGDTLYLPKNKPVIFKIRAKDVLHSVFLPHFRVKMDAVPGTTTQFHFNPIYTTDEMRVKTGNPNFNYELACTEICGKGHFSMRLLVYVVEEDDYQEWYASKTPTLDEILDQDENYEIKGLEDYKKSKKKNLATK